jgi:hypothetical protein
MSDKERTDETQRSRDTLAGRVVDDGAITGGSVDDTAGAGGDLAGSEAGAGGDEPGAGSGIILGAMTGSGTAGATMAGSGLGSGGNMDSADTNAADTPMPVNEEAAEIERRGILRDPINRESGGESHG